MTAYERKPNRVEAVLLDLSKGSPENNGNWHEVVRLLGPHQTRISNSEEGGREYYVFDVASKTWIWVPSKHYIVRDADGAVWIEGKESFEEEYQVVNATDLFPNTFPSYPGITYGGTARNG